LLIYCNYLIYNVLMYSFKVIIHYSEWLEGGYQVIREIRKLGNCLPAGRQGILGYEEIGSHPHLTSSMCQSGLNEPLAWQWVSAGSVQTPPKAGQASGTCGAQRPWSDLGNINLNGST